jgi:hypothetical protein
MISINIFSCDYPLPIPQEHKEKFASVDWSEIVFLTPSICSSDLYRYSISPSGHLYLEDDGENQQIRRIDYTGEIILDCIVEGENCDSKLFFKILYFKGDLKEATFEKIEYIDNSRRIKLFKEINEESKKKIANESNLWHSLIEALKIGLALLPMGFRVVFLLIIKGLEYLHYYFYKLELWIKS